MMTESALRVLQKNFTLVQLLVAASVGIIAILLGLAVSAVSAPIGGIAVGALSLAVVLLGLFYVHNSLSWLVDRRLADMAAKQRLHTEAIANIFNIIRPRLPLPPTDGWAMSAHSLVELISCIRTHRPNVILELGGGLSTIVAGYCAETLLRESQHATRIISIDHETRYLDQTTQRAEAHGLTGHIRFVHAPLTEQTLGQNSITWYQAAAILAAVEPGTVDLLIIDAPPDESSTNARYPALPILWKALRPGALVLLDDYDRTSEREIVARWISEFDLSVISVATLDQSITLRKNSSRGLD